MSKKIQIFILLIALILSYGCSDHNPPLETKGIVVIVEDRLFSSIKSNIEQYKSDLLAEGYNVIVENRIGAETPPQKIKEFLKNEYEKNENIEGAVFIGNIPSVFFNELKHQGDPYWHDYLADFYYMDLDGIWEDSDNNGVYDQHRYSSFGVINWIKRKLKSDLLKPEIWVSRIKADNLVSLGDEVSLLKDYFEKNHKYRTRQMNLPAQRAFVIADGVDVFKSGWGARPDLLYSNIDIVYCQDNSSDSLRKFLNSEEGYEWGIINVFSGPRIHHFDYLRKGFDPSWWESKESRKNIAKYSDTLHRPYDINSLDIRDIKPNVLFYHLLCSEAGRFDIKDYLAGAYIFFGSGLVAVAGTQHSGSVGDPVFYESLAEDETIGQAWKNSLISIVNTSEEKMDVYFCDQKLVWTKGSSTYKAVLIGDGTLKIPERNR